MKSSRFSRLKWVLSFTLSLNLILLVSLVSAQHFTIKKFHSDITVRPDSSFIVRETIAVTFHRPRHGIFRDIPFKYRDELGKVIETPTEVLSVTDGSGRNWRYRVSRRGPAVNIRIGDSERYVQGSQTYTITYRVENAILFFNDHDELYWNVTGNDWEAVIQEASADVSLGMEKKSKDLWLAAYTGRYGSTDFEGISETRENGGKFLTQRRLTPGEGLTIAFGWDKGLVSPPSGWKRFLWAIDVKENWVFLFPPLAFIYMFFLWRKRGRDPKVRESITVTYEPPKFDKLPLAPAEVGALLDERLDPRDLTATIVGLAVKGYLKVEEIRKEGILSEGRDYDLRKMKESDSNLGPFERELMSALFADSLPGTLVLVSSLKNRFYTRLKLLKKILYGELVRKKYFLRDPEKVRHLYAVTGIILMFVGVFLLSILAPFSVGKAIAASVLTGFVVLAFGRVMPAKTKTGAQTYMDILGFQEFMNRAEKDRLERMGDKSLFSKFLSYAIALDVVDNWAKAFEGIYQEPPDWYISPVGFRTFSPSVFNHSLDSVTSSLGTAMFSAPRGSGMHGGSGGGGGGGGGSSGGGFGGGGGGSW